MSLYLKQLQTEGYYIFIVTGVLPACKADTYFEEHPFEMVKPKPKTKDSSLTSTADNPQQGPSKILLENLQEALALSFSDLDDDQKALEQALKLSLDQK